jgi:hypothetical protein
MRGNLGSVSQKEEKESMNAGGVRADSAMGELRGHQRIVDLFFLTIRGLVVLPSKQYASSSILEPSSG